MQTITPDQFAALERRVALLEKLINAESRVQEPEKTVPDSLDITPDDFPITIVQKIVARISKTPLEMFTLKGRIEMYSVPRQIAMYLCVEKNLGSSKAIGLRFGGREHSTVLHAHSKIKTLPSTDPYYKLRVLCEEEVNKLNVKRAP